MGVNGDPQEANDRFRESLDLPFPLVGDPGGTVLKAYRVRWPIIGIAHRVTYLIDQDRTIREAYRNERDVSAHAARACAFASEAGAG